MLLSPLNPIVPSAQDTGIASSLIIHGFLNQNYRNFWLTSWISEPKLQEFPAISWISDPKTTGISGNFVDFWSLGWRYCGILRNQFCNHNTLWHETITKIIPWESFYVILELNYGFSSWFLKRIPWEDFCVKFVFVIFLEARCGRCPALAFCSCLSLSLTPSLWLREHGSENYLFAKKYNPNFFWICYVKFS